MFNVYVSLVFVMGCRKQKLMLLIAGDRGSSPRNNQCNIAKKSLLFPYEILFCFVGFSIAVKFLEFLKIFLVKCTAWHGF